MGDEFGVATFKFERVGGGRIAEESAFGAVIGAIAEGDAFIRGAIRRSRRRRTAADLAPESCGPTPQRFGIGFEQFEELADQFRTIGGRRGAYRFAHPTASQAMKGMVAVIERASPALR